MSLQPCKVRVAPPSLWVIFHLFQTKTVAVMISESPWSHFIFPFILKNNTCSQINSCVQWPSFIPSFLHPLQFTLADSLLGWLISSMVHTMLISLLSGWSSTPLLIFSEQAYPPFFFEYYRQAKIFPNLYVLGPFCLTILPLIQAFLFSFYHKY